ncbi:MAG: hypothetical protein PVH88_02125 [Ignavibacteria bacterium]|jgi:hypothetical protein
MGLKHINNMREVDTQAWYQNFGMEFEDAKEYDGCHILRGLKPDGTQIFYAELLYSGTTEPDFTKLAKVPEHSKIYASKMTLPTVYVRKTISNPAVKTDWAKFEGTMLT